MNKNSVLNGVILGLLSTSVNAWTVMGNARVERVSQAEVFERMVADQEETLANEDSDLPARLPEIKARCDERDPNEKPMAVAQKVPEIKPIPKALSLRHEDRDERRVSKPEPYKERAFSQNFKMNPENAYLAYTTANMRQNGYKSRTGMGFNKKATILTEEEQVISDYSQALEYLNSGMELKAEHLFGKNLERLPNHARSRIELANIYLKTDRLLNAEELLLDGLKRHDNQPEMLKLMAMAMERQGEWKMALNYLNRVPYDQKNDKPTAILLGHLYQKTNHFGMAKQQYDRLLQAEPENPLWLFGRSMALDGAGHKKEALAGYLQLEAHHSLEPSIVQYVKGRITTLRG